MNRTFDASIVEDNLLSIRVNDDEQLSFKINPNTITELEHYHNVNAKQEIVSLIISELNNFYNFTDSEVEEYTETLKIILVDD